MEQNSKTPLLLLGGVNWRAPLGRSQSGVVDSRCGHFPFQASFRNNLGTKWQNCVPGRTKKPRNLLHGLVNIVAINLLLHLHQREVEYMRSICVVL